MKMQVAFLPDGKFALVLSGAHATAAQDLNGLREDIGAAVVLVFEDDVELEGFAAHGRLDGSQQRTSDQALRDLYDRTRTGLRLLDAEREQQAVAPVPDHLGEFIEAVLVADPDAETWMKDLYDAFTGWCFTMGIRKYVTAADFAEALAERGYQRVRMGQRRGLRGLRLMRDDERTSEVSWRA